METKEAPEKIYIVDATFPDYVDFDSSPINTKRIDKHDIEYIRKDAFIEKSCQFIKEHHHEFSFWNTEEYELGFSTQKFIEDFKNYMKGE